MKSRFRIWILLGLLVAVLAVIFGIQVQALGVIREQVKGGLQAGLENILQQTAQELGVEIENELKQEVKQLADFIENDAEWKEATELNDIFFEDRIWTNTLIWAEAGSNPETWRLWEIRPSFYENTAPIWIEISELVQQLSPRLVSLTLNEDYWQQTVDSTLLLSIRRKNGFSWVKVICQPIFDASSQGLNGCICLEVNEQAIESKLIPHYFKHRFSLTNDQLDYGIQREFVHIKLSSTLGPALFNSALGVSTRMEKRIRLGEVNNYGGEYLLEMGFVGTNSETIAESLHRRNLMWTTIVSLVLLILLFLIYQTYRKAQRLVELKSDFLNRVSHELKTPLTGIKLAADTLRLKRVAGPEEESYTYGLLQQEVNRMERLLLQLLNFARLDAGANTFKFEAVNLLNWAEEVVGFCENRVAIAGFELEKQIEIEQACMWASADALHSLVEVLLDNALKYSGESKKNPYKHSGRCATIANSNAG